MTYEELIAINQQIELENNLIDKYKFYSTLCENPQLKAKCEQLSANHQKHCDKLLNLLR